MVNVPRTQMGPIFWGDLTHKMVPTQPPNKEVDRWVLGSLDIPFMHPRDFCFDFGEKKLLRHVSGRNSVVAKAIGEWCCVVWRGDNVFLGILVYLVRG